MAFDDAGIRLAAFDWLAEQVRSYGDVLPRPLLASGFAFRGERIRLLGPQGIFKPRALPEFPLSITTAPNSPYGDCFSPSGLLHYSYRGKNIPHHRDNASLRSAIAAKIPMIYLYGILPGQYVPAWPVYIVGDNVREEIFTVAVDDAKFIGADLQAGAAVADTGPEVRRGYITAAVRRRLHQQAFRARVLEAYRKQCAVCRLRHAQLLDAAHIIPDSEAEGEPVVSNGLALCKLHHSAYDHFFLTIREDYVVEIHPEIMGEKDGPMLLHGLQGLNETRIILPRDESMRPNREFLERRRAQFLSRADLG